MDNIDRDGFRANVGIILSNGDGAVFLAGRMLSAITIFAISVAIEVVVNAIGTVLLARRIIGAIRIFTIDVAVNVVI